MERSSKGKKERRLILISLSPAREKILLEDPELVSEIVSERHTTPIPGSLEFDGRWIALQRALFDFLWQYGADDERAEALAPRSGPSIYDDGDIDAARLVPSERARAIAQWVTELPEDMLGRVARKGTPSPASRSFPEAARPTDLATLAPELARLQTFYAELLRTRHAVLSIRFRE